MLAPARFPSQPSTADGPSAPTLHLARLEVIIHTLAMPGPLGLNLDEVLAEWASRVYRNEEQAERHRSAVQRSDDFYEPTASWFKWDPKRIDDAMFSSLSSLIHHGETVLDIGAGGGRYAYGPGLSVPPLTLRLDRESPLVDL